jgi:hypothetical protein
MRGAGHPAHRPAAVEKEARGSSPERAWNYVVAKAKPILDDLETGCSELLSGKTPLASAIRYALTRTKRSVWIFGSRVDNKHSRTVHARH